MNILNLVLSQALPIGLDSGASAPLTIWQTLANLLLSPSGVATAVTLIASILGLVVGTAEVRRRRVALAINAAFHIAEDLAAAIDGTDDGFDKAASALKALDQYLLSNGWRKANAGEIVNAQLQFSALNGVQKVAEKVAINAIAASNSAPIAINPAALASDAPK